MQSRGGSKFALLALLLGGCASSVTPNIDAFAHASANNSFEVRRRAFASDGLVLPVVHDRQDTAASCGAHALASVINYWRPASTSGDRIYAETPPADRRGYSLLELQSIAIRHGLLASAVRLGRGGVIGELEHGRPVLVPVVVPAVYVENRSLPGANAPVLGLAESALRNQMGGVAELAHLGLVNHYLLVVGYDHDQFAIVEPVMGYRTITQARLERYRQPFNDAALVFSAAAPSASTQR
jgi:hypothetical protein